MALSIQLAGAEAPAPPLGEKSQQIVRHAMDIARKAADAEFLARPECLVYREQIQALEEETNAVYEMYLNLFRHDPSSELGKKMRAERDERLRLIALKLRKVEGDFEAKKQASPAYASILAKRQAAELKQVAGRIRTIESANRGDSK